MQWGPDWVPCDQSMGLRAHGGNSTAGAGFYSPGPAVGPVLTIDNSGRRGGEKGWLKLEARGDRRRVNQSQGSPKQRGGSVL